MNQEEGFGRINELLENTDYPIIISSIEEIEDFLIDGSNKRYIEEYCEIRKIFDEMSDDEEKGVFSDITIDTDEVFDSEDNF